MALTINTNVASLNAQRNLNTSQTSLATSLQRLSSGLRINSAKDDAAGLAITERFTTQIRGLNQAVRNANDGISMAQTAEGALGEITNNLQRIRELAVQSSNATNSSTDQAALQSEVSQLLEEINRVADQTSFNSKKLLDGSFAGALFQVGANAGESIAISSIVDANTAVLGGTTTQSTVTVAATSITGFANAVNTWSINGVNLRALGAASNSAERAGQVVNAINEVSQQSGVGAAYDAATGQVTLTTTGTITFAGADATVVNVGFTGAQTLTTTSTTGIATLSVGSYTTAQLAIAQVDNALGQINTARASLGAIQNRFQSTVTSLQTTSENLSASRSRIQDADFASETANLTRGQILQQAGTAILAQANSLPNGVLALLRG